MFYSILYSFSDLITCIFERTVSLLTASVSLARMQGNIPPTTRVFELLPPPIRSSGVPLQITQRSHPQCPPDSVSLNSVPPPPHQTTFHPLIDPVKGSSWLLLVQQGKPLHPPQLPQEVVIIPLRRVQRQAGNQLLQKKNHSCLPRLVSHLAELQPPPQPPMVSRALLGQQIKLPLLPDCPGQTPPPMWP